MPTSSCSSTATSTTSSAKSPSAATDESDEQLQRAHEDWRQRCEQTYGKAEVIVAKQRHGPTGIVRLAFEGQFTKFGNLAADDDAAGRPQPSRIGSMSSPAADEATRRAGAVLTIDLGAIAANWRGLRDAGRATGRPVDCAAVLKADAYGTGAAVVGPRLAAEGCRQFFVAHLDEGIAVARRAARAPDLRPERPVGRHRGRFRRARADAGAQPSRPAQCLARRRASASTGRSTR